MEERRKGALAGVRRARKGAVACLCAMLVAAGALVGCSGGSSSEADSGAAVASDDTNASGITVGAYIEAVSETSDNDSYDALVLSDEEISEVYSFVLEGEEYTLPCEAQVFADAGWSPNEDLTVAAQQYSSAPIAGGGFSLNSDEGKTIGLQLVNTGDEEASWADCLVVGITVEGDSVSFSTSKGLCVGDEFSKIQEAYGASSYDVDRYGTIGFHFSAAANSEMSGARWYGQEVDTLTFLSTTKTLYADWSAEQYVDTIRMEYFGTIEATE